MTALLFLAIPVVIIAIGAAIMWLRHHRPKSVESGIADFQREMRALSPDDMERRSRNEPRTR